MAYYLAVDIGASSGRHIVAWDGETGLETKEVYRFPNGVKNEGGSLVWDIDSLTENVKIGFDMALDEFPDIKTFSIDTWGVDYVLLREGGEIVRPVYAYRDSRTEAVIPEVHEKIPFSELYERTGIQFQPFNSVYQLCDDLKKGRLGGVTHLLMIPEYLMYKLTGVMAREYTNATTMGLVSAETGEFDNEILSRLSLPKYLFPKLSRPGAYAGEYKGVKCILCATHDTGSAVEGIPMDGDEPYISSGTWSLLGVKTPKPICDKKSECANYSNEGGVGYNRYQKNIMGMWIVNNLRKELCPDMPFPEIEKAARESCADVLVDVNAQLFLAPESMKAAFDTAAGGALHTVGDYFRCAFRSLADSYRAAVEELEHNSGRTYHKIYIVGGGAKNQTLNRWTEEFTGKEVVALPIEATALGNLKIQREYYKEEK
ncbi:MAG: rhamnulokinase [Oscillospiraceae bacterium]|nr:rhamnulokinase [Oscillospiraceae bacterium]